MKEEGEKSDGEGRARGYYKMKGNLVIQLTQRGMCE